MARVPNKENRLAIAGDNKKFINSIWHSLSEEEQKELFEFSVSSKNLNMVKFLYRKDKNFCNLQGVIKTAFQNDDIEMITYLIERNAFHQSKNSVAHNVIFIACVKENRLDLIEKLDSTKFSPEAQLKVLVNAMGIGKITLENKLIPKSKKYQPLLDLINQNNINIINNIEDVLDYMLDEANVLYGIENIQKLYGDYINNTKFLNKVIENNPERYPNFSPLKLKQYLLNKNLTQILECNGKSEFIMFFLKEGANIDLIENKSIEKLCLESDVELMELLVEKGLNIEIHKKSALNHHVKNGYVDMVKYWINYFNNKEEALNIIKAVEASDPISGRIILSIVQEEMEKYIHQLIFEEKLQKELPVNDIKAKMKL